VSGHTATRGGLVRGAAAYAGLTAIVVMLAASGLVPAWPGLAHLVALPPLGLFTDVRLALSEAPTILAFLGILAVSFTVRTGVLAFVLGGRDRIRFAALLNLALLPVALLVALLTFVTHAALYSGLFWIGLVVTILALGAVAGVPWAGHSRLRAGWRTNRDTGLRIWTVIGYLTLLAVLGGAGTALGTAAAHAAVPVSAALTVGAIVLLSRPPARPARPGVAALGAVALVAAVIVADRFVTPTDPQDRDGSIMLMSGMTSASGQGAMLEIDPAVLGYACEQVYYFSYAGPGDGQPQQDAVCPIRTGAPYDTEHTRMLPFARHVDFLAAQVADLPEPVVVAGHSQGAWAVWAAASEGRLEGVEAIVVVGPFPDSPTGYPPPGVEGPGRVGGIGLRALEPLGGVIGFEFGADETIAREMLATASASRRIYDQPLPDGIAALNVPGIGDLVIMPGGSDLHGARDGCPAVAAHPDLPLNSGVQDEIVRFLNGDPPRPCGLWRQVVRPLAIPFGVPPHER
jgi:hypothetical protein